MDIKKIEKWHELQKQKQESGVMLAGYHPLKFKEHIWNKTTEVFSERMGKEAAILEWKYPSDELISLVHVIVKVDHSDTYLLKNKYRQAWESFKTKSSIYEKMFNDYQSFKYESITLANTIYTTDADKIKLLVYGKVGRVIEGEDVSIHAGTIPSVYEVVNYPFKEEFLCTDTGQFVLNIGSAYETIEGVADYNKASTFLRMIYRSLCNYPAMQSAEGTPFTEAEEQYELYRKVMENDYLADDKDFKFVVNWCAAVIQKPGINLMTNIWFAGEYQGVGKGTLVNFLKFILGKDRVAKCKANMIKGNFNAALDGRFLLEINEKMQDVRPDEMTNWLKGFSQEDDITIEKKGVDTFDRINMVNVIGTAQTPEDVFKIEDDDRRNVIFRTVVAESDPKLIWRKYAKKVAEGLKYEKGWGEAVAFLLERVVIDWALLSTAYQTRGYAEVKSTQLMAQNQLYLWALTAFDEYKRTHSDVLATVLFEEFKDDNPSTTLRTQSGFNKKLKELKGAVGLLDFELISPANRLTARF